MIMVTLQTDTQLTEAGINPKWHYDNRTFKVKSGFAIAKDLRISGLALDFSQENSH